VIKELCVQGDSYVHSSWFLRLDLILIEKALGDLQLASSTNPNTQHSYFMQHTKSKSHTYLTKILWNYMQQASLQKTRGRQCRWCWSRVFLSWRSPSDVQLSYFFISLLSVDTVFWHVSRKVIFVKRKVADLEENKRCTELESADGVRPMDQGNMLRRCWSASSGAWPMRVADEVKKGGEDLDFTKILVIWL